MRIYLTIMIVLTAVNPLLDIVMIGQERSARTKREAVLSVVISAVNLFFLVKILNFLPA